MIEETQKPEQKPAVTETQAAAAAAPVSADDDPGKIVMPLFISTILLASIFSFAVDGVLKYFPETPRAKPSITEKITIAPK